MLDTIENILAARSAEQVWQRYVLALTHMGFPHVSYHGMRLLRSESARMIDDSILLSSHSPRLLHELLSQNLLQNAPMYRWMERNQGSESWDWMRTQRIAGRLKPADERAMDLFTRYGYVAGYAISLGDSVARLRAGVILNGAIGQRQDKLDDTWSRSRREIEVLTGVVHLRIASMPFNQPEEVLTLRQREVLECISVGQTTQEIAELLDVTPATVEKHLRLARKALGARTTAQAILLAASRRQIFIDPGEPCSVGADGQPGGAGRQSSEPWRFTSFSSGGLQTGEQGTEG